MFVNLHQSLYIIFGTYLTDVLYLPREPLHVNTTILLQAHALAHQEDGLLVPARYCAPYAVHHPMARQAQLQRRLLHRTADGP